MLAKTKPTPGMGTNKWLWLRIQCLRHYFRLAIQGNVIVALGAVIATQLAMLQLKTLRREEKQ
jgi:hypothetical protein